MLVLGLKQVLLTMVLEKLNIKEHVYVVRKQNIKYFNKMRIREQGTYKSFFTNSFKTIRLTNGIPKTPELLDVAINSKCNAACSYCYTSAMKSGDNFINIVDKANQIWGVMDMNDRPFQIAIGGAGEPTLHPDFIPFVKKVRELGIIPNYTTNGMHLTKDILDATEKYCGGVALSWHPHISKVFHKAIHMLSGIKTKLNVHVIVGYDDKSYSDLIELYEKYNNCVDYFVILPYQSVGRGESVSESNKKKIWLKVFEWISNLPEEKKKKFAFGALFYEFIIKNDIPLQMSIYNPDVYSGYILLNDNYKKIYKSSYELIEKSIACN